MNTTPTTKYIPVTTTVEGKEVELIGFPPQVGEYTIYQDKIWRIVGAFGPRNGNKKTLERQEAKERISIPNSIILATITKPTGYISV